MIPGIYVSVLIRRGFTLLVPRLGWVGYVIFVANVVSEQVSLVPTSRQDIDRFD